MRTIEGNKLHINASLEEITVSGASLRQKDVLASNGVLHTVSSLLLPPNSLTLNAEKYLLALNCSTFVDLLRSVNLTELVTNPDAEYTILAPRDDVLDGMKSIENGGDGSFPDKGSDELKKSLRYHFIPGKWTPEKLKDGTLLETELIEVGLAGGRQVLDVGVSSKSHFKAPSRRELYFGGAGVIGDPILIDKTLIYLISRPLAPPTDVLTSALPSLSLSTYIAAVFSTSLAETLKNLPRTTFLIPKNSAWERLGLVSAYLLMNNGAAKKDLESVVLHHTLDSIRYLEALKNGTERTFRTIEGTDVTIERRTRDEDVVGDDEDDSVGKDGLEVVITGSGGWDGLHARLALSSSENDVKPINTLTQTGVMHVIDTLLLPRSVDITLGKLVRAAGGGTMASLVVRAGMEWVLNGTAPPEDSDWAKRFGRGTGWTLLVPRDEAWKKVNLTALWDDKDAVRGLVSQHLVPSIPPKGGKGKGKNGKGKNFGVTASTSADANTMPLDMYAAAGEGVSHVTARSAFSSYGQISFHDKGDYFIVGIADARGTRAEEDWAKVISWGRSTSTGTGGSAQISAKEDEEDWTWAANGARRGGVIKIDRVLVPYTPKWWVRYGPPVAGAFAGFLVVFALGFTARWLYKRRESEPTYEPVGRDEEEDG